MKRSIGFALAIVVAMLATSFAASPAFALDDKSKKKASADKGKSKKDKKKAEDGTGDDAKPVVLKNGLVMTMTGRTYRRGTVVMKDGKIEAIGEDVEIPKDATVVDCTGKVIMPGFVPAMAWGVGLGAGRFRFMGDLDPAYAQDHVHPATGAASAPITPPDCAACDALSGRAAGDDGHDHTAGGAHYLDGDVGYLPEHSPHGLLHAPGCACADIDAVYRAQNLPASALSRLELMMPDRSVVQAAGIASWTARAFPCIEGFTAGYVLGVDHAEIEAVKAQLNPFARDVTMMNAAGITTVWLPGTGSAPEFAMLFGAVTPPSAGTGGVVIKMARDQLDDMFISDGRFLVADFRRLYGLRKHKFMKELADVKAYLAEKAAYDKANAKYKEDSKQWKKDKRAKKKDLGPEPKKPKRPKKPSSLSKGQPLFEKKRVLRVFAETVPQLRLAAKIAKDYGIEVVIDDATEGWAIAGELASAGVSVVLNPRRRVDRTDKPIREGATIYRHGWNIRNAAILSKAGVNVAVIPPGPLVGTVGIPGRDLLTLPLDAAFAARGGMSRIDALRTITINSAKILGQDDRVGSLEPGKDADILVLDGDPLDHKTFVERTYVNGRLAYEKDKEALFDYVKRGKVVKPVWDWRKPVRQAK